MSQRNLNEKIIFGLKVKQQRLDRGLSFADLSKISSLSISYLNEIEKGKKYPKEDKIPALAEALGLSAEELLSPELPQHLSPVDELLRSNFLNDLPLDLFGIEMAKVVEIVANAPAQVGAFISTLIELARNYALREESFYFGALRAYQELHLNYFTEWEEEVDEFMARHGIGPHGVPSLTLLYELLERKYQYQIEREGLKPYDELRALRAVFVPHSRRLLLNAELRPQQQAFVLGRELAFSFLRIKERPYSSPLKDASSFEYVLNNFRASYFAVALQLHREPLIADMQRFFAAPQWDAAGFLALVGHYNASPEMFLSRLTSLLPRFFGLKHLFFLRFSNTPGENFFQITKELHLNRHHHPHGNGLNEHYCRRWVSITLLQRLAQAPQGLVVGVQRSRYIGTNDEYLCITLASPAHPTPDTNISVTLGLLVNSKLRKTVQWLDDPQVPIRMVNKTCERCAEKHCAERAVAPIVVERKAQRQRLDEALSKLIEGK